MDTPGLLLNREYYLSSTFLRSLRLVPLSLQSLVRCTSSISSFGETLSFTEGERERERESETKRDAYRIPRIGFLFFFSSFENSHFPRIDRDWVKVMSVGGMDICRDFLCRSSYAVFFFIFYYYYYFFFGRYFILVSTCRRWRKLKFRSDEKLGRPSERFYLFGWPWKMSSWPFHAFNPTRPN